MKTLQAVQSHDSVAEAQRALTEFVNGHSQRRQLNDLGDEAWGLGEKSSLVELRKGRFTVSISTWARVSADPDAAKLTYDERESRAKADTERLGKEFAKHFLSAIGP